MQTLSLKILPLGTQDFFFPHWYLIFVRLQIKIEIDIDAMVALDFNIYEYKVLINVSIFWFVSCVIYPSFPLLDLKISFIKTLS